MGLGIVASYNFRPSLMAMDDHSHVAPPTSPGRSSGSAREDSPTRSRNKRHQIAVACNACRKRKTRCDGSRPTCSVCTSKKSECTWSADPDATPMVAMKRKFQTLESESRDLHDLMQMLTDRPRQEAFLILDHMRKTRDTSSTLAFVREGDLLTGLNHNTADSDSNAPNSAASDQGSVRAFSEGIDHAVVQSDQRKDSSSTGGDSRNSAGSHSPMRRLAISDLVNGSNT